MASIAPAGSSLGYPARLRINNGSAGDSRAERHHTHRDAQVKPDQSTTGILTLSHGAGRCDLIPAITAGIRFRAVKREGAPGWLSGRRAARPSPGAPG
jgi:hypothetical protein